nr:Ig-like domain-containing protein [Allomuricauda sp.]
MKNFNLLLTLAFSATLFFVSCSNDDDAGSPIPTIDKIDPAQGPVGTVVTIEGSNFSDTDAENTVKIGNTTATVVTATTTRINITVPEGATTGPISVTVGGKTGTSSSNFTVTEDITPLTVVLNSTALTLYPFPQYTGSLAVTSDLQGNIVTWSSSDESIATVNPNGLVTPIAIGTTIITATVGSSSATATITVADGPLTSLELNNSTLELFRGDEATLTIATLETAADPELAGDPVWNSSDANVANVDQDGNITAIEAGTTTISVTVDNLTASCEVTVNPDVYVLGRSGLDNNVVWKNGTEQFLISADDVILPKQMSVDSNGLIYVLDEEVGTRVPEVWTIDPSNGSVSQSTPLTDAMQDEYSNVKMYVENGVVYVAASAVSGNDNNVVLWINGQLSSPSAFENSDVSLMDFFVRDGVIYAVVRDEDSGVYAQMVGEDVQLINAFQQETLDVISFFVDEEQNTYILVDHPSLGGLYVNGVKQNLQGDEPLFTDVVADQGIVYVGGQNNGSATIWNNGTSTPQSVPNNTITSSVRALTVYNGQIHAVGYVDDGNRENIAYWKNNAIVEDYFNLEDNNLINDTGLEAIDIFLR